MPEEKKGAGKENLHANHRNRLRSRFLKDGGFQHFEEHQAVELLLFYVFRQGDTNPLAHRLLRRFGSFSGLLEAPPEEIAAVEGAGPQTALFFQTLMETIRLYHQSENSAPAQVLDSPEKLGAYFLHKFLGVREEMVYLLLLDNALHELGCELIGTGRMTEAALDVRKAAEAALRSKAAQVVLAHNHPSGSLHPSNDDIITTSFFRSTMKQLGIELLDHIIVAGKGYISLRELEYL